MSQPTYLPSSVVMLHEAVDELNKHLKFIQYPLEVSNLIFTYQ